MSQNLASLSLDLDNKWSYLKTHGDESWREFPSYLDTVVPRILEILERRGIKITVFVVGQDAELPGNRAALESIASAGHEIANHSFHHEPWLHLYSRKQLIDEFERSEAAILEATGQHPIGFRGPGFSISDQVLQVLGERGYEYDGSIFPTYLGPVARAYYFCRSRLNRDQRKQRKALFGRLADGRRPLKPFAWNLDCGQLVEIPVTTMPLFKLPIHLSYIHYLAGFSRHLASYYFWQSIQLCRAFGVTPSILLHPLDFLGREDDSDLGFFPGMNLSSAYKLAVLENVLEMLEKRFELITMREHAFRAHEVNLRCRETTMVRPAVG